VRIAPPTAALAREAEVRFLGGEHYQKVHTRKDKDMTTMEELAALSREFDEWFEDRILTAQAHHGVPSGYCAWCGSAHDSPDGGWHIIYPDDGDVLELDDIKVESWGGRWYRACSHCNDPEWESFRLPTVPFTLYEEVGR
jgi:hypothetical protein